MGILLGAMLLGLIPALIARSKGRNAFGWWIYGSLLFIIALPHSLLVKENLRGTRRCPYCAEAIRAEAVVCRFCHRNLVHGLQSDDQLIRLIERLDKGDKEKRAQGSALPTPHHSPAVSSFPWIEEQTRNTELQQARRTKFLYVVILVILIGGIGAFALYPHSTSIDSPSVRVTPPTEATSQDDLTRFVHKHGQPDTDDSTQYDTPRPPIVTRWLIYKKAQVRVWFVPDAKVGIPPPYKAWKFSTFQDESTQKGISADEVERRLKKS